ncbi:exonuclease domain-containing protein [Paenibacillus sp. SN-8-1]|uniref:exonuclease domain-containing protein n=1 Tax=Paenibacillus sp. SN-8-1 TaxID=3435409 RepID=UPI003D9A9D54
MKYIIFDMEFTVLRSQQHLAETIEIGAIELKEGQDGTLVMTNLFHSYVQPSLRPKLSKLTTEFTGVTQEQVNKAPLFPGAISNFKEWLEGDDYYLCSWGPDDKHQLVRECHAQGVDREWLKNYNDIQLPYTRLNGADHGQRIGLKRSLQLEEIPFIGKQHNALDDAFNTAKLFKKIFPQLKLEQNNASNDALYISEVVYSTGGIDNKPFGNLAQLLQLAL